MRPAQVGVDATTVVVAGVVLGEGQPTRVIAGPCSVEGFDQFRSTALAVRAAGADLLRGGAFKPRTSPYSFQGLGREGLEIMRAVADELLMGVVTEAMAPEDVPAVAELADMVQIGARNMANQALLRAAGASGRPILLKRGMTATVEELIEAASTIFAEGNDRVVLCERGSRTFEPSTRNSVDIAAVADLRQRTGLPVILDPSHGTGRRDLVTPVSLAGVAAGADGLLVEVHPDPDRALSDGAQSLRSDEFEAFMAAVGRMAAVVGRGR
jgi:3-deoxy-7-phosphoheptulonate synthase